MASPALQRRVYVLATARLITLPYDQPSSRPFEIMIRHSENERLTHSVRDFLEALLAPLSRRVGFCFFSPSSLSLPLCFLRFLADPAADDGTAESSALAMEIGPSPSAPSLLLAAPLSNLGIQKRNKQ